ncbi:hypothetical protein N7447_006583 [Penicillium robsamsonii]|uniref:uncharacterized protein n=1 Tax=Penicillium robsamsonii TaxID=1792511 RepID=UPI0025471EB5|nr:uncharacterized protein N7447_006583 [Penicillium robsamsonii]KAJ5824243.1 hypothetical protein N7447_006583 [Penicillium robsamsonii]
MASHKMQNLINYRMRVTLNDGRQMTGSMLAFDKHMNLVLADTEEFRRIKRKSKPSAGPTNAPMVEAEEKRSLGLTIVRGTQVVSCSVEGPPPADPSARLGTAGPGAAATLAAGPGISKPAGRGLPIGLGGPAAGVGGPPPPGGFGFPPGGFPGAPPPGFAGRGGPPVDLVSTLICLDRLGLKLTDSLLAGFAPPPGFAPQGGPPAGFQPPPGFQPPGQGRGYPPPGFGGR